MLDRQSSPYLRKEKGSFENKLPLSDIYLILTRNILRKDKLMNAFELFNFLMIILKSLDKDKPIFEKKNIYPCI